MSRWTNIFSAPGSSSPTQQRNPEVPAPAPTTQESLGAQFGDAAEAATTALGRRLQAIAKDVAGKASVLGVHGGSRAGVLGAASTAVAVGLDRSGKFLESEGFQGAVKSVSEQMKRNPIPFLLVGIGLGYLAGRQSKSRES
ncbi:MAG TPA: hypothetical protein VHR72_12280 [Gemmataceae bacterium]|nr:hypothetical protein [Gemmataceae bacterium]